MDTITQGLLGAAIAEAGFRRKLGGKAVGFGFLVAVAPDLDMAAWAGGHWAYLVHHRGATHSLIVMPLLAPLIAWLGYRWAKRRGGYLPWAHLTLWALVTHTLLDLMNSYGTQLFAPFSRARYALDTISVIDLFYSVPLLVAVVLACFPRVPRKARRNVAIGALALSTAYLGLGYYQSTRAVGIGRSQLAEEGFVPEEIRATPMMATVWRWRVVARGAEGDYRVGVLSTWAPHRIAFERIERSRHPLVSKALATEEGRIFEWFTMGWVHGEVKRGENGAVVVLHDLRYALPEDLSRSVFAARWEFDEDGRVDSVKRLPPRR